MKVKFDWVSYDSEDNETTYEIECDLTPYDPGRTYGPPEKCYPPEGGECEILSVKLAGVEVKDWGKLFNKKAQKEIEDAAFQKAADDEEHAKDAWAEAQEDTRRIERIQDREDHGFHD